jgi:hypothetical protein
MTLAALLQAAAAATNVAAAAGWLWMMRRHTHLMRQLQREMVYRQSLRAELEAGLREASGGAAAATETPGLQPGRGWL